MVERTIGSSVDMSVPSHEYIFKRMFMCIVNQMDITSKEYLTKFGMPTTGDPNIDREMANQLITTYKTIADMVDLFRQGITVRVPKQQDCKTIYEYVDYHIQSWAQAVQNGLNLGNAPLQDLIEMDKFATKLYPYALDNKLIMENSSVFVQQLGNNFITHDNVLGTMKSPTQVQQESNLDENGQLPQRESYADIFINRGKGWK